MAIKKRLYDSLLTEHLNMHRQMAFVSGARQIGKTTTCRLHAATYVNWDNIDDREQILAGPAALIDKYGLNRLQETSPTILFDELHKYPRWKQFLKGFFDQYADTLHIIVTGSSRLDIYRRGGDSLMGRYFVYRMHPFSVAEIRCQDLPDPEKIIRPPGQIDDTEFAALWSHGGYPEPFIKRDKRFSRRWQSLRNQQLVDEDIRDLTQIQHLGQLETLTMLLNQHSSQQLIYSSLARQIRVSVDTLRRWIDILCKLHMGYLIRPWFKNVTRSLRKEPKWFLRDWANIEDAGRRAETFIGCHLLKAVEGWTDMGLGDFRLAYLRDKNQREVDFVVIRDHKPWFLVEVKHRDESLSKTLEYYRHQLETPFAFQVVIDTEYVNADCFARPGQPIVVPARTFLSQLL